MFYGVNSNLNSNTVYTYRINYLLMKQIPLFSQTSSSLDLVDGLQVFYFGRTDLQLLTEMRNENHHGIHNCATLSFIHSELVPTVDGIEYSGVGFAVRNCKSYRFLCHGNFHRLSNCVHAHVKMLFIDRAFEMIGSLPLEAFQMLFPQITYFLKYHFQIHKKYLFLMNFQVGAPASG